MIRLKEIIFGGVVILLLAICFGVWVSQCSMKNSNTVLQKKVAKAKLESFDLKQRNKKIQMKLEDILKKPIDEDSLKKADKLLRDHLRR